MASESSNSPSSDTPQSIFERLINSTNRESGLLLPLILGFTASFSDPSQTRPESEDNPDDDSGNRSTPGESTRQERIVLINPVTQTMTVIEGGGEGLDLDALFRGAVAGKGGQPPAAKSAVEALPRVEITDDGGEKRECVICLEEYELGSFVKKMPCEHAFHDKCIEKWLSIHGNCPVCRYKMPVDEEEEKKKGEENESSVGGGNGGGGGRVSREVWVSFSVGGLRRRSGGGGGEDGGDQSRGGDQMMDID